MSYLVQILLPIADNDGRSFPDQLMREIQSELAEQFGGITAHTRAPAEGVWRNGGEDQKDDIVIAEVMTDRIEEEWWRSFRKKLESVLGQKRIIVRSQEIWLL